MLPRDATLPPNKGVEWPAARPDPAILSKREQIETKVPSSRSFLSPRDGFDRPEVDMAILIHARDPHGTNGPLRGFQYCGWRKTVPFPKHGEMWRGKRSSTELQWGQQIVGNKSSRSIQRDVKKLDEVEMVRGPLSIQLRVRDVPLRLVILIVV
jgi:hypothetical protein